MKSFKRKMQFSPLYGLLNKIWQSLVWLKWVAKGKPLPPPHEVKQLVIGKYAKRYGISDLIETGTYRGKMIIAMRKKFNRITSIELDQTLAENARKLFIHEDHITILQGNSANVLSTVIQDIKHPVLFWLDGHYSGGETANDTKETPIMEELEIIFSHPVSDHVILIDDALCFNGSHDYPTIEQLKTFVPKHPIQTNFKVNNNIIYITPA